MGPRPPPVPPPEPPRPPALPPHPPGMAPKPPPSLPWDVAANLAARAPVGGGSGTAATIIVLLTLTFLCFICLVCYFRRMQQQPGDGTPILKAGSSEWRPGLRGADPPPTISEDGPTGTMDDAGRRVSRLERMSEVRAAGTSIVRQMASSMQGGADKRDSCNPGTAPTDGKRPSGARVSVPPRRQTGAGRCQTLPTLVSGRDLGEASSSAGRSDGGGGVDMMAEALGRVEKTTEKRVSANPPRGSVTGEVSRGSRCMTTNL